MKEFDKDDFLDLIETSISDSMDMDWTAAVGAEHVYRALVREGFVGGLEQKAKPMVFLLKEGEGVLFDPQGKFHGWIMRKHPDGLWVSVRKLEAVDPDESLPGFLSKERF